MIWIIAIDKQPWTPLLCADVWLQPLDTVAARRVRLLFWGRHLCFEDARTAHALAVNTAASDLTSSSTTIQTTVDTN